MRIVLLELNLMSSNWIASNIEDEEARAGGAIVNGPNEDLVSSLRVSVRTAFVVLGTIAHDLTYHGKIPGWLQAQGSKVSGPARGNSGKDWSSKEMT